MNTSPKRVELHDVQVSGDPRDRQAVLAAIERAMGNVSADGARADLQDLTADVRRAVLEGWTEAQGHSAARQDDQEPSAARQDDQGRSSARQGEV